MSLRRRVHALLEVLHLRVTKAEDVADRVEAAASRIEVAVVELAKTVRDVLERTAEERGKRSELGITLLEHEHRLEQLERERRPGANGSY